MKSTDVKGRVRKNSAPSLFRSHNTESLEFSNILKVSNNGQQNDE